MPLLSNRSNQKLFINTSFVSGLQSLSFSYSPSLTLSTRIEESECIFLNTAPIIGRLSAEILSNSQSILDIYTGNGFFSGKIEYSDRFFDFKSGYLNNFGISYGNSGPVTTSIDATIYGSISESTGTASKISLNEGRRLQIYDMNYVLLDLAESSGNFVQSFDISISTPRYEKYEIGEYFPSKIGRVYPTEINCNINFIINELDIEKNTNYITGNKDIRDINLRFYVMNTDNIIKTINLSKAKLDSESIRFSLNEGSANLSFTSYILSGSI